MEELFNKHPLLVILAYVLIVSFVVGILSAYFDDKRLWNTGTCERCNTNWKPLGPKHYSCDCRRVSFVYKIRESWRKE